MQFYFSGFSIGFLTIAIASFIFIGYLFSVKNRSTATNYMIVLMFSMIMSFINLFFVFASLNTVVSQVFLWFHHVAVLSLHGLLMFVYHFPRDTYKEEASLVNKISLTSSIIAILSYVILSFYQKPEFQFIADAYFFNIKIPAIVVGIQFVLMFIVMFRKIYYYSEEKLIYNIEDEPNILKKVLLFFKVVRLAKTKRAKALKGFGVLFLYAFAVPVIMLLNYSGVISWVTTAYLFGVGILILLFFFIVYTLNHMTETTTFQVKLLGITLIGSLVVIGIVGTFSTEDKKENYISLKKEQIESIKYIIIENKFDKLNNVNELEYILEINNSKIEYVYLKQEKENLIKPHLNFNELSNKRIKYNARLNELYFSKFEENNKNLFFVNFDVMINNQLYEIGFNYISYRQTIHETAIKVLLMLIFATIIILTLYPLFFRKNIAEPLNNLLEGIKKVQNGSLNVEIQIIFKDEIGFLTDAFNSMIRTIKTSKEELENYASNLESMVKTRTQELSDAKDETDRILENVDEGLFLIMYEYGRFIMGSQYSKILKNIFMSEHLSKVEFNDLVSKHIDKNKVADLDKFLKLMFKKNIDENTLYELNPLNNIKFVFQTENKYLIFKFRRVIKGRVVSHLLVTVRDVTAEVELAEKLAKTEHENKTQMEILFKVLNTDTALLNDFIFSADNEIDEIELALENQNNLLINLEQLYRSTHTIKGNASLLDLTFLAETAHILEEHLQNLKNKHSISIEDSKEIYKGFESLKKSIVSMNETVQKLLLFKNNIGDQNLNINNMTIKALENLIEKNSDENKSLKLETINFDLTNLETKKRVLIKDILVQFVRNSIAHGIENHDERILNGKDKIGTIKLTSSLENGIFKLIYEDDGKGINIERIKQKAIENKTISEDHANKISNNEIANLIFLSGISSATTTTMMAGRGVGLDLVKDKLNKINGSIYIEFEKNKFTRFVINI